MPVPASAGRSVILIRWPVCKPMPEMAVGRAIVVWQIMFINFCPCVAYVVTEDYCKYLAKLKCCLSCSNREENILSGEGLMLPHSVIVATCVV